MQPLRRLLLVVALLATAIIAGFFYAYSVSVMPGLTASDPVSAINAMKAINAVVRTVEFAVSFFGALALPTCACCWRGGRRWCWR
jgi:uncharacterized membrane protein